MLICMVQKIETFYGIQNNSLVITRNLYSNPSVYEQSVYKFSLIRDAQISTCFSIYKPIFACTSSFRSQTDRCSRHLFSGSDGKLIFVLRVFALQAVLEERIKLVNRGITVFTFLFNGHAVYNISYFSIGCKDIYKF
jgi:hypothetical protein